MALKNRVAFYSRIKLLFSSLIDFLIIGIFFNFALNLENIFFLGIRQYFYVFIWIFISYIFDRYNQTSSKIYKSEFLKQIISSLKSIIIFGIVFLFYNWILGNYISRSFLLIFLSSLFLFSSIFQYLIHKFIFKELISSDFWVFYLNDQNQKWIRKCDFFNQGNIKVLFINSINNNIQIINGSCGIVLKDYENLSKEDMKLLLKFKKKGKEIYKLSNWLKIFFKRYPPNLLDLKDFLEVKFLLLNNSLLMRLKRFGDILISLFLLIASIPIFVVVAILIYLEDRGPIFYSQKRNGYLGGVFNVIKLRSMSVDAENKGVRWSSLNDSRITNVGRLIRKTRIDELPQLWSVFVGDMSLIGPRPERPEFDQFLIKEIPFYNMRYLLRPGLSGWAQVNYPYGASIQDTSNKLSFDLYYIANYSFWLDLIIFFKTLRLIFNAKGSKPNS